MVNTLDPFNQCSASRPCPKHGSHVTIVSHLVVPHQLWHNCGSFLSFSPLDPTFLLRRVLGCCSLARELPASDSGDSGEQATSFSQVLPSTPSAFFVRTAPPLFAASTRSLFLQQKPRGPPPARRPTAIKGGGFQRGSPPFSRSSSHISSSPPWLRRADPPSPNPRRDCGAAPFPRPARASRPSLPRYGVPLPRVPDRRGDRPPPTRRTAHTATSRQAKLLVLVGGSSCPLLAIAHLQFECA
nr:uncharacterized protein LOC127323897 [Lolium perenne]